jgi:transposase
LAYQKKTIQKNKKKRKEEKRKIRSEERKKKEDGKKRRSKERKENKQKGFCPTIPRRVMKISMKIQ